MQWTRLSIAAALASAALAARSEPEWVAATVLEADAARGMVTLQHGPIRAMGMDAMTMPFRAAPPELLRPLRNGSRVRFAVANRNGEWVVTHIEPVAAPR